MRYTIFGQRTGLKVSELVLGTGMFGTASGYGSSPDEVRDILRGYREAGGNFIDTSDAYQLGESERLIGGLLASGRDDVILSSKYSRGASRTSALAVLGNHRKAMIHAVEASLKRLGTDRIDVYFVHLDDGVTPIEEIVRGLDDLVRAGKIVYGGLSNFPAWRVATAATTAHLRGWTPLAALQVEYSLLQRTAERELVPMAQGFSLGLMGYSPLGAGLLDNLAAASLVLGEDPLRRLDEVSAIELGYPHELLATARRTVLTAGHEGRIDLPERPVV